MGHVLARWYISLSTVVVIALVVTIGFIVLVSVHVIFCRLWFAGCDYTAADGTQSLSDCNRCGKAQ